jgi:hypothetical protein
MAAAAARRATMEKALYNMCAIKHTSAVRRTLRGDEP